MAAGVDGNDPAAFGKIFDLVDKITPVLTVSVQEDLTYMKVAYMEDRSISEGDSVMEYTN